MFFIAKSSKRKMYMKKPPSRKVLSLLLAGNWNPQPPRIPRYFVNSHYESASGYVKISFSHLVLGQEAITMVMKTTGNFLVSLSDVRNTVAQFGQEILVYNLLNSDNLESLMGGGVYIDADMLLFNISLNILPIAIRQEKKGYIIRRK